MSRSRFLILPSPVFFSDAKGLRLNYACKPCMPWNLGCRRPTYLPCTYM